MTSRSPAPRRARENSERTSARTRGTTGRQIAASRVRSDREIAAVARALGHPARVAILRLLFEAGECVCGRIVEVMPLAQATVSQHLKVLKDAGLIRGEVDGPRVCYCAHPDAVRTLGERLIALAGSESLVVPNSTRSRKEAS